MKNIIIAIFTTCLLCTGCVNENISNISQKDQNLKDLYCLAKEVGCDVKIKLSEEFNQPISKEQFDMYRSLFENISKLDGYTFHLSSDAPKSRVFESFSYSGDVTYEGRWFSAGVFWQKDNQTGEIKDVVAGLGGRIYDTTGGDIILYTMTNWGQTINEISNGIISLTLKADYTIATYPRLNGSDSIDISRGPLSEIVSKVGSAGQVDTEGMTGSFTAYSAGPGSWSFV
ncbi:MAG: hypothetical protein IJY59_05755 [Bacteroidaceae bacterium]|nr:hypothetical protein [Bacteroidaceae bacterium]